MNLLPGTGYQRAGKTSRIIANGSPLAYASWSVKQSSQDLDTMNMESWNVAAQETFTEGLHDGMDAAIDGGGSWDAHAAPYGVIPGIYVRDDLPQLLFYTSRIDNVFWTFPYARLRSTAVGADVKALVTFTFSGNNQGPFTTPSVSV